MNRLGCRARAMVRGSSTEEALALESYKLREKPKQRDQYVHLHGEHAWDFRSVLVGKQNQ